MYTKSAPSCIQLILNGVAPQKHWDKTLSHICKLLKTNGELVAIPRDS
jgi:hypothetical protein